MVRQKARWGMRTPSLRKEPPTDDDHGNDEQQQAPGITVRGGIGAVHLENRRRAHRMKSDSDRDGNHREHGCNQPCPEAGALRPAELFFWHRTAVPTTCCLFYSPRESGTSTAAANGSCQSSVWTDGEYEVGYAGKRISGRQQGSPPVLAGLLLSCGTSALIRNSHPMSQRDPAGFFCAIGVVSTRRRAAAVQDAAHHSFLHQRRNR